jgi:hypothetical protein
MLWNRLRAHFREGSLHPLCFIRGACGIAFGERQQNKPPVQEGCKRRWRRPQSLKLIENGSRFRRAAELQQGQGLLESPMAQRSWVARRRRAVQKRHRFGRSFFLQKIGRQIESRSDVVRRDQTNVPLAGSNDSGSARAVPRLCRGRSACPHRL